MSLQSHAQDNSFQQAAQASLQKQEMTENYIHSGYIQREMEKKCNANDESKAACRGESATALGKTGDMIFSTVAQMYSLFGLTQDVLKSKTPKTEPETTTKTEQGEQHDYCRYIPLATTIAAQALQTSSQQRIQANVPGPTVAQKETLYQKARSHKARAKTAGIEALGWAATTTCYTILVQTSMGLGNASKNTYMKIGAAAFLTWFYNQRRSNQKEYEKIVKDIADSLPGKGDCNPITETNCYCSQVETENDTTYCTDNALGCVDANMLYDANCTCRQNNTCADSVLNNNLAQNSSAGFSSQVNSLAALASGKQVPLDKSISNQVQVLEQSDNNIEAATGLNSDQLESLNLLKEAGIPNNLASQLATTPLTPDGQKILEELKEKKPVTDITGSTGGSLKRSSGSKRSALPLIGLRNTTKDQDVLSYQNENAIAPTTVNQDQTGNLFDSVHKRYRNYWEQLGAF